MNRVYFTEDHEWISVAGDFGTVGITDYAQEQLGDIVFIEVTKTEGAVAKGDDVAVVESVKAASDIYSPVSGTVTEINPALDGEPEIVNADAMGAGWMYRMMLSDPDELGGLMDEAVYRAYVDAQ